MIKTYTFSVLRCSIVVLLLTLMSEAYSQQRTGVEQAPYPLTKREVRWLEKRGFSVAGYDWSNDEVNHYLLAGLEQRKGAQKIWLIGALTAGGSLVISVVGVVGAFAVGNQAGAINSVFVGMSIAGFIGFWGSVIVTPILAIIKGNKARKFVRTAIQILLESERKSP